MEGSGDTTGTTHGNGCIWDFRLPLESAAVSRGTCQSSADSDRDQNQVERNAAHRSCEPTPP
eukprot:4771955-Prymnesium_polylepis.1